MHVLGLVLNAGEQGVALMVGAAIVLYLASRAAADALTGGPGGGRPGRWGSGRLAVGHWLPIAAISVVATGMGRLDVAVGIVFATAVGCLSLGVGALAMIAPTTVAAPPAARRVWPLLVPVGLLPLVAGFHRDVRLTDAIALAVEGLCVLAVWGERRASQQVAPVAPADSVPAPPTGRRVPMLLRPPLLVVAVALSAVGAALAVQALAWSSAASEAATPGLLTATVLAPLVVLPILGSVAELATHGPAATGAAASSLVGVALLDGCAGLPLVVAVALGRARLVEALSADPALLWNWHGWPRWLGVTPTLVTAATRPAIAAAASTVVPFPLAVWRVDVVAFLALSAALLPVALGRYAITRAQGFALIVAYAAYLFLALKVGVGNA